MSWSYDPAVPSIYYVRLLVGDNNPLRPVWSNEEIQAAYQIQASTFQSSMFYSGTQGQSLPSQPVSYYRVAALLLDSLAANRGRLASIKQLLDVTLDPSIAAKEMRATAKEYREIDDNSGAFIIVEQCTTVWSFIDRFWSQIARQQGGGF